MVDRQEDVEKNHQQCSATELLTNNEDNLVAKDNVTNRKPDQRNCPQQMSATGGVSQHVFSHLASPPLEVEQEIPLGGEQVASKVLDRSTEGKKDVADRQEDVEKNHQQCSATHLASPPLEVEQEIPSDGEQVASKVHDGNAGMEVFHSCGYNQQVQGSVTSQADQLNRHEVSGQHGGAACDIEEGEIYDAEDGKEVEQEVAAEVEQVVLKATKGHQQVQASPPLPPTTPGSILI